MCSCVIEMAGWCSMCVWAALLIESIGNGRLPCDSLALTSIPHGHLDAMMQGQDPVNFDLDYYNTVEIRASASTIEEYTAGVRMENRKNAKGNR